MADGDELALAESTEQLRELLFFVAGRAYIAGVAETGTCPGLPASFRAQRTAALRGALGKLMLIRRVRICLRRTAVERVLAGDAQAALAAVEAPRRVCSNDAWGENC